jgi:hypothetical protein
VLKCGTQEKGRGKTAYAGRIKTNDFAIKRKSG